jgi:chromosome segregation ATPase
MSKTPLTDSLSTFLVTQFPATLGHLELHSRLLQLGEIEEAFDRVERELAAERRLHECGRQRTAELTEEVERLNVNLEVIKGELDRSRKELSDWKADAYRLAEVLSHPYMQPLTASLDTCQRQALEKHEQLKGQP